MAVKAGRTVFHPRRWENNYYRWMEDLRDWCISRQLWWGHQIPAWYCDDCGEIIVLRDDPTSCTSCGASSLRREEDVLDTWFSSGLFPFSTMGWPDETEDLRGRIGLAEAPQGLRAGGAHRDARSTRAFGDCCDRRVLGRVGHEQEPQRLACIERSRSGPPAAEERVLDTPLSLGNSTLRNC